MGVMVGIEGAFGAQFGGESVNARIILHVLGHQHVRHDDLYALRLEEADRIERALERAGNQRDGVVNFRPVRIDADLDRFDVEFAEAGGLALADDEPHSS